MNLKIPSKKYIYILILLIVLIFIVICVLKFLNLSQNSPTNNNQLKVNNFFKIEKIVLYSDIFHTDNSEFQKPVFNINLHQFSDISIYINKTSENFSDENVIKDIYLDNFKFENFKTGKQEIFFKDYNYFGTYSEDYIKGPETSLNYKVVYKNENKNSTNSFYYDFSEPLVFEFLNENIINDYIIKDTSSKISFDGKILSNINVPKDYFLSGKISFDIHIINNLNSHFVNNITIDSFLEDNNSSIYDGHVYKTISNEYINQGGFYEYGDN